MVEATESDAEIILGIKEGRGFEQVTQPTQLIGTLNGHSLETDKIESNSNPQYATDLVWETTKATLKKMRSGQAPLKLECFAFKENEGKERIGYILLSIRSAQITWGSKHGDSSPRASWHKMLGLKSDFKVHKPELLLTLSVEDRKSADSNVVAEVRNSLTDNILQTDKIVPYLNPDEQLIQLGPLNICCELFLLSITVTCVENLHLLLPKHLTKEGVVCFSYRVLENDIELKSFKIDEKTHSCHERVVMRIQSSLSVLKQYLQLKPYLSIYLKHENHVTAHSLVNLQSLVPTDNLQEFLKCTADASTILYERCFLIKSNLIEKPSDQYQRSHLDIELKLQYIGNKTNIIYNPYETINSNNRTIQCCNEDNMNNFGQKCSEIESHRNPSGDFGKLNPMNNPCKVKYVTEHKYVQKRPMDCQCTKYQKDKVPCLHTCDTILCNYINKHTKDVGSYRCYCLDISLMAITLVSPKIFGQQIEFRFHHPKAEFMSTAHTTMSVVSGEKSKLENVRCQFHFISTPDEINQLLQSYPPKISIHNMNESDKLLSLLLLDIKPLFNQIKPECEYKLLVHDMDRNKIGDIDVMLKLEDRGPHFILKKEAAGKNLGPPILDDSLAYKIVDELETWKERQKEMFKVELKRKEERHLNILNEEWQKQKENLESKLAYSVEQCKMLANSLNNATEDLRTRRLKSLETETRLIKANEDLQWRYETKLQELNDSLYEMQNESKSKIIKLEEKKTALETQVEILLYENENLKSSIKRQADELQVYQKGSLTQDQTASLLQELKILEEKLDNAQKGKAFFKEQWGKAVRELHRIKVDNQQAMQVQIKNSKEELKNVDLAEILSIDTKALADDQILLNELQKEIDIIKPKRKNFTTKEPYQIFPLVNNSCVKGSCDKTMSDKSEKYNERLQALREERDSLLKTGSYAVDDIVIKKINTEIQSLLVNR